MTILISYRILRGTIDLNDPPNPIKLAESKQRSSNMFAFLFFFLITFFYALSYIHTYACAQISIPKILLFSIYYYDFPIYEILFQRENKLTFLTYNIFLEIFVEIYKKIILYMDIRQTEN